MKIFDNLFEELKIGKITSINISQEVLEKELNLLSSNIKRY